MYIFYAIRFLKFTYPRILHQKFVFSFKFLSHIFYFVFHVFGYVFKTSVMDKRSGHQNLTRKNQTTPTFIGQSSSRNQQL